MGATRTKRVKPTKKYGTSGITRRKFPHIRIVHPENHVCGAFIRLDNPIYIQGRPTQNVSCNRPRGHKADHIVYNDDAERLAVWANTATA